MDESEILPAPVINVPQRNDDKWERERSAFHRLLPNLMTTSRLGMIATSYVATVRLSTIIFKRR